MITALTREYKLPASEHGISRYKYPVSRCEVLHRDLTSGLSSREFSPIKRYLSLPL